MQEIKEPDWKVLRRVHPLALERFCERVLAEIDRVSRDGAKGHHALSPRPLPKSCLSLVYATFDVSLVRSFCVPTWTN
jgi:hypothetical protein